MVLAPTCGGAPRCLPCVTLPVTHQTGPEQLLSKRGAWTAPPSGQHFASVHPTGEAQVPLQPSRWQLGLRGRVPLWPGPCGHSFSTEPQLVGLLHQGSEGHGVSPGH